MLPPPRLPIVRAPARARLMLVIDDDAEAAAPGPPPAAVASHRWALAGVGVVLALSAALVAAWASTPSPDVRRAQTVRPAALAMPTLNAATVRRAPLAPELPVVDVNSLPAAPLRATRAAR